MSYWELKKLRSIVGRDGATGPLGGGVTIKNRATNERKREREKTLENTIAGTKVGGHPEFQRDRQID